MPFSYYHNLSKRNQAIYRHSDRVKEVKLPDPGCFEHLVLRLRQALEQELQSSVRVAANQLCRDICEALETEPVGVKVLARRPSSAQEELHGLYELHEDRRAQITVWMRTAKQKKVVAFKTFLRTLLHELCHHLDYHMLDLSDSYHTEGFFSRESSLAKQLILNAEPAKKPQAKKKKK